MKTLYEVGPEMRIDGNEIYKNQGGVPWEHPMLWLK